jgi:hypothetical protein
MFLGRRRAKKRGNGQRRWKNSRSINLRRDKVDLPSKMIRASIGVLMRPKKVSIEL